MESVDYPAGNYSKIVYDEDFPPESFEFTANNKSINEQGKKNDMWTPGGNSNVDAF